MNDVVRIRWHHVTVGKETTQQNWLDPNGIKVLAESLAFFFRSVDVGCYHGSLDVSPRRPDVVVLFVAPLLAKDIIFLGLLYGRSCCALCVFFSSNDFLFL